MDLITDLIDELTKWRATERVAQQDTTWAEEQAIAADLRLQEARRAQQCVACRVNQLNQQLADAICAHTAPADVEVTE
jgi:hypothetical protein